MTLLLRRVYGLTKWLPAVLFCCIPDLYAQKRLFAHLRAEDGLSQNSVLAITQDRRGFMWFGTRAGLNRYDARRFVSYRANPSQRGSLSGNYILSLLCDSRNNLWVGTRNGLNRYLPGEDTFEQIGFAQEQRKETYVNCLFEDSKKRIWVAAHGSVYLIHNVSKPVLSLFSPLAKEQTGMVYAIAEDSSGNTWIGTANGLFKLTPNGNRFNIKIFRHNPQLPGSLADNNITSIAADKSNNIWVGTLNGGLHLYHPATGQFTHFRHNGPHSLISNHVRKILPDNDRLWIGTQEGVSVFDTRTQQFGNYVNEPGNTASLSQNSVHSLFLDNAGTVWIGTFFGGVNSHSPYFNDFPVYANDSDSFRLNNNVISSVVEDREKNLWIGTEGGGLNYCDTRTGKVHYYMNDPAKPGSLGSNLVKVVYKDKQNNIWVGTHGGGLNRVNENNGNRSFTRYAYDAVHGDAPGLEISSILEDHRGLLWVGTERRGVRPFIRKGNTLLADTGFNQVLQPLQYASVGCLLETVTGALWIGTTQGIYVLDNQGLKQLDPTRTFSINCLFADAANRIWAGTAGNGLICLDVNGRKIAAYTAKEGLLQENILGILQDRSGRLWMSTADGLVRMNTDKTFKTFNRYDGLAGNTFNNNSYYLAADGKMFFGGYDGLTSFYPDQVKENTQPAPVYITGVSFPGPDNRAAGTRLQYPQILQDNKLVLQHNRNVFTIGFALLNFIKPGKNTYAYRLEGYDETWRYTTEPVAAYTNVPPGEYTFWCKGSNNDGVWSMPASLPVTITPPFWKTWWAYTFYTVAFMSLVFFVTYFFYLRALYKRNNELTQLKLNFFTNISHEIRTHLSLIIGSAEKLVRASGKTGLNKPEAQTIKSNSESLLQLVNELMDFRKAETGHLPLCVTNNDMVAFVNHICTSFTGLFAVKHITVTLDTPPGEVPLWFDKVQMEKVLYNVLFNACKFTPAGGFVKIALQENYTSVVLQVSNNGNGIAKENLDKLFDNYFQENDYGQRNTGYGIGLALSRSIVELHKGTIRVTSEKQPAVPDYLTCFSIELLKGNKHFTQEQLSAVDRYEPVQSLPQTVLPGETDSTGTAQDEAAGHVKKTVLVVEDNKSVRTMVKEVLQEEYVVIESADGRHGWEQATENMPDLIISDVMMPVMDGLVFCEKLKTDIRTSHIPVVLLTAKTSVENQVSGLQVGADVYLTKPFSLEVLEWQVRNLLAARERTRQQFARLLSAPEKKPAGDYTGAANALEQQKQALHPLDEAFLNNIIKLVDEHTDNPDFGVAMLSRMVAMSQPVLLKKIKAITGMSANEFVKSLRLKKACNLLLENRYTVFEVAYMVGYENSKYFSKEFKKEFGRTPTEFAANK